MRTKIIMENNALYYAVQKSDQVSISYLLAQGADINVRHYNKTSALGYARANKHKEAEIILLDAGSKK